MLDVLIIYVYLPYVKLKLYIMKKIFLLVPILLVLIFTSCENEADVKSDLDKLRDKRTDLTAQIQDLNNKRQVKNMQIIKLNEELKVLNIYMSGSQPKYIITIQLKQSHVSLSLTKHLKDVMNAIDFEIPVSKEFYNSVRVGTVISDEFRTGSLILYGSFGNWEMTVNKKEIK